MVILLSAVISLTRCHKFIKSLSQNEAKRLYGYSILPLMMKKKTSIRCLGCNLCRSECLGIEIEISL